MRKLMRPRGVAVRSRTWMLGLTCSGALLGAATSEALAQTATPAARQNPTPGTGAAAPPASGAAASSAPFEDGFGSTLFSGSRTNLLGDMWGLRTFAQRYGVTFGATETSEVLGNATGGLRTGADYDGLTLLSLGVDTQKMFGWSGGTFNVSALQIHGRDLATDDTDNLNTPSGIEANRATRLWELWFQQLFWDGKADVKIGQQSLDQEFLDSSGASTFINTMMGWPVVPSYDLYAGGPAYPLSSLGVRLRVRPTDDLTLLLGVFDDNPPGGPFEDDSQIRGAEQSGTAFDLGTGALVIGEVQYAVGQPSGGGKPATIPWLPGTYKLGFWYDTGSFPAQNPPADDPAAAYRGNWSVYAVIDQTIWQPDPKGSRALGIFARLMGSPDDRNLISFGANAGLVLKAPLPGRDNDTAGIGYGIAKVGDAAILADTEAQASAGGAYSPVRSSESFVEATYQYQVAPWWQVQPDAQYIFLPGGGIANPNEPGRRIGNEAILGVRTNVTF